MVVPDDVYDSEELVSIVGLGELVSTVGFVMLEVDEVVVVGNMEDVTNVVLSDCDAEVE